jgi:hypothetical protein
VSTVGCLCAIFAQTDPFSQGTNEIVSAGHTMVFLAFLIAGGGIAFRVYRAKKKRANRAQGQVPWTPPPPTYYPAQAETPYGPVEHGVFCPRCGVRSGANFCITCGYDLQTVMRQVHEKFTGNRA